MGQEDQLDGFAENVSSQWNNNGDVNWDLSDTSEAGENDFYIDDSEPADLEGLMVVYDEVQYKDNDLQFEVNDDNKVDFNFEESELEFSYEPGISLASLATCACPCLRHHETGHCQNCILDGTKG